jgi:NAD(P)-dependent dehydrogenase (short-subunit alcohol dehydrogenase family)/acyl carrier protein
MLAAPPALSSASSPSAEPETAEPALNVEQILLQVVSEKTGYPIDVLDLDMELEAGLGIDSIKRVEIFSAVQQRQPNLSEVKAEHMASLRTLRQIVAFLGESNPSSNKPEVDRLQTQPVDKPAKAAIDQLLLELVSQKTGYPVDVLDLDMELEAGLGIDSIKRVEIFSAVQQRQPNLPEVKAENMASLRTLRQIITFLDGSPQESNDSFRNQAPESNTAPLSPSSLSRQEVRAIPIAQPGLPLPGIWDCTSLSVKNDGDTGIAALLVEELRSKGLPAVLIDGAHVEGNGLILTAGFEDLERHTTNESIGDFAEPNPARHSTEQHLDTLHMLQAIKSTSESPAVLVTIQNSGGDFNLSGSSKMGAWHGGISAMAKTAAMEWPHTSVKIIDIESNGQDRCQLARRITDELLCGGDEREIGLQADGTRTAPVTVAVEAEIGEQRVGPDSVLVVSGGARGVTAACLIALAEAHGPKLALLGRTRVEDREETDPALQKASREGEIKRLLIERVQAQGASLDLEDISRQTNEIIAGREIRETLERLRRAGSESIYLCADVNDAASVSQALEQVRAQWGPITGLIHAAGVLADKKIEDKTDDQFRRVFATKVGGFDALLTATGADPLNMIVCFSSVAARCGNMGQCDYAAANEVLNQLAAVQAKRRGSRCLVKSINWGPWEGGMVTPALAAQFKAHGTGLIPLAAGAEQFVREVNAPARGVEVLIAAAEALPLPGMAHDVSALVERSMEILVSSRTYPLLDGHRIQKDPAVPVVMVLEWFHRFAGMCFPHLEVCGCHDLRVLRGVLLPDYDGAGHLLRVQLRTTAADSLQCELRSADGNLHYSARLDLRPLRASRQAPSPHTSVEQFQQPEEARNLYNNALFHGRDFQVIHSIQNMDAHGASATLAGTGKMAWQSGPWQTEAAALDGALQVVRLWGIENLGRPSLPTRVGSYVHHASPPHDGLLNCTVQCRSVGNFRTVSEIQLADFEGRAIAELHDVEMHVLAN